jgi:predicted GIY-YIG superfamily endonuclease
MTVYLLHFETRISDNHSCQHYIGSSDNLDERLEDHKAGRAARLTQVAVERGIDFVLARTWEGGRVEERKLKNRKNAPKLCPICNRG